ncbi:MAG TPA: TonB family protein [Opitutaceae bacterium]|nr:TonB family protein [Opitutaceae bacterium]
MSILTSPYPTSLNPGQRMALVAAPAISQPRPTRRVEPVPSGPQWPDDGPPPLLEHLVPDPYFKRTFIMLLGGIAFTVFLFLSLPLTQKISERGLDRAINVNMDRSVPPPPTPPPEIKPREEPKPQENIKPELKQEVPKLNLSQLEAALNPGHGGAGFADLSLNFGDLAAEDLSRIFELAELDRAPVPIFQPKPIYPYQLNRERIGGEVRLRFVVSPQGTVRDITVVSSSRFEFERSAKEALAKWRFEPGVKHNTRVSVRMEQPIPFVVAD